MSGMFVFDPATHTVVSCLLRQRRVGLNDQHQSNLDLLVVADCCKSIVNAVT